VAINQGILSNFATKSKYYAENFVNKSRYFVDILVNKTRHSNDIYGSNASLKPASQVEIKHINLLFEYPISRPARLSDSRPGTPVSVPAPHPHNISGQMLSNFPETDKYNL
jgi:hypothetical protein